MIIIISSYFILFIIYSIFGWICEILFIFLQDKKLVNRGFLIGPYCPIYGCGCILLVLLLNRYINEPFALFALSMLICALLEYFTSWIMEKLFRMRWWDYSNNRFNINGRICLETMIPFGIGGVLIVHYINPFLLKMISLISSSNLVIIAFVFAVIFILDNLISFNIILNLKNITKNLKKDSTDEIKTYVRKVIQSNKYMYKRLLTAFPKLEKVRKSKNKK